MCELPCTPLDTLHVPESQLAYLRKQMNEFDFKENGLA